MQHKKSISIRLKLMGIIIPVVLIIIISFFTLSRKVILKLAQDDGALAYNTFPEIFTFPSQEVRCSEDMETMQRLL